ncbi:MAG: hypothetical protein EBR82_17530 [Caulobacteraceae bacterium]|nr:hypothetical protein [Caulobacteraceae bacterium]
MTPRLFQAYYKMPDLRGLLSGILILLIWFYLANKEQKQQSPSCWYEVKYLHLSGQEKVKKVYMDCRGFRGWKPGYGAEVPYMIIELKESEVELYGATDILSIKKL